jgi:hypothetical protein
VARDRRGGDDPRRRARPRRRRHALREAHEFYGTLRGQVQNYVNGYAVQSLAHSLPFDAQSAADVIKVPVLIVQLIAFDFPSEVREFEKVDSRSTKLDRRSSDGQCTSRAGSGPNTSAPHAESVSARSNT